MLGWACRKAGQEQLGGLIYSIFPSAQDSSPVDHLTAEAAGILGHRIGLSNYQVMWQRKGPKC